MKKIILQSLCGLLTIPIFLLFFFFSSSVHAQSSATSTNIPTNTPSATPTVTPNPTIVALQNVIATQQVDIQTLQRDIEYEVKDMRLWFKAAGLFIAILGAFGYNTYKGIDEQIKLKIRRTISKYLYQLDLTNLDVYVSKRLLEDDYKKHDLKGILKSQGIELLLFDQKPSKKNPSRYNDSANRKRK